MQCPVEGTIGLYLALGWVAEKKNMPVGWATFAIYCCKNRYGVFEDLAEYRAWTQSEELQRQRERKKKPRHQSPQKKVKRNNVVASD